MRPRPALGASPERALGRGPQTRRVLIVAGAHHADAAADLARLGDEVAADLQAAGARIVGRALLTPGERAFTA